MQVLETPEDADVIRNANVPTGAEGQVADEKHASTGLTQRSFRKAEFSGIRGSWRVLFGS